MQRKSEASAVPGAPWRAALLASAAFVALAQAQETQWRDLESRIQYAFYTEDARALANLAEAVTADESHDQWHGYYAGLVAWRQAQLAVPNTAAKPAAGDLVGRCVHALDAVLEVQPDFAEALALRSACQALPLAGGGLHVPFAGHRPRKDLDHALELAGRNPRVLLIDAEADYQLPPSQGGNKDRALTKLRRTVSAFEAERGGPEPMPGWGAAEGYYFLGRDLLEHGDAVGARDALEHALLLAPQYAQAKRLMAKITSG